jgi:MATE family multidrug resistance protein
LRLALPLVVSTASWTMMNFIDRMFLCWYSTEAMAATLPAGMLHFTILCFPLGVAAYVNTFVAQYQGANRPGRIGAAVWQGVWVGVIAIPVFLATIPFAPAIFRLAGHSPDVAGLEATYYQTVAFGAGGAVIAGALSSFFTGRGQTSVVMLVSCTTALVNVVLDYAWIFGRFGFPAMGIAGAGIATAVAEWCGAAIYWRLMERPAYREVYQLRAGRRFDRALFARLLRYGGPNGLQMLVEVSGFTLFLLLVGRLGSGAMAATTLAFNVNSVAFVPMLGMGVAVATIVGQQLGRNRPNMAARATWTALWMAMAYMGAFAVLYVAVPDVFLMGHAARVAPEQFVVLRDQTVVLLRFVAAYCLFDALNLTFVSAIKGAGDTRFVLLANLILTPTPVLAAWVGVAFFGWGLIWCWIVLTGWVVALGLVFMTRFLQGRWRTMRVIEPDLAIDDGDRPDDGEPARVGDWSIFRREDVFGEKASAENMDLSPSSPSTVDSPEEGGWPASDG